MFSASNAIAGPSTPASPAPAVIHDSPSRLSIDSPKSPLDSFFGYTLSQTPSRENEHDRRLSSTSSYTPKSELMPPAYIEPPTYETRQSDPATLAMFLFKFGFLFPPFWIFGSLILLSPLRVPEYAESPSPPSSPAAWLPEKTSVERQQIITKIRSVEVRWAKRCLMALCVFIVVVVAVALATWGILKITQNFHSS